MKNKIVFAVLCNILLLLSTSASYAAFPIKKAHQNTHTCSQTQTDITVTASASEPQLTGLAHTERATKKQSFFSKLANKAAAAAEGVSQVVYIILAILPLGWLGIGLNEDWQGNHWWIALILYLCFWLPGIVYSFIMMGNYY